MIIEINDTLTIERKENPSDSNDYYILMRESSYPYDNIHIFSDEVDEVIEALQKLKKGKSNVTPQS